MRSYKFYGAFLLGCLLAASCTTKKEAATPAAVSYVVSDSLKAWCTAKLSPGRISYEGTTVKLIFFQEELNQLWKPVYDENAVKEMAEQGNFRWQELPVHEGNRRWELSLDLQTTDSTYATPNNLLLYLFR